MWQNGIVDLGIIEIMTDGSQASMAFNYFFTLIWVFGLIAVSVSLLIRVLSRS